MKLSFKTLIFNLKYVLLLILVIVFLILFSLLNYTKTCGKIVKKSSINSCITIKYEFKVKNQLQTGSMDIDYIKNDISIDSLQKIKCIEIKYSNLLSNINWISDKRIVE